MPASSAITPTAMPRAIIRPVRTPIGMLLCFTFLTLVIELDDGNVVVRGPTVLADLLWQPHINISELPPKLGTEH